MNYTAESDSAKVSAGIAAALAGNQVWTRIHANSAIYTAVGSSETASAGSEAAATGHQVWTNKHGNSTMAGYNISNN